MQNKHLTILLTDIKGFTSKTSLSSRSQTVELLKKHKEIVVPVIEKRGGRVVKNIGDAFLAVFESPTEAVLCGIDIQENLKKHNEDKNSSEKIEIRIAINSGEVAVSPEGDVFGEPVNITSRLESIAEAGQVFFTEAVYLAMNKNEVPSSEIGYRQFKGIPQKIKVYRVLRETPVGKPEEIRQDANISLEEKTSLPLQSAGFFRRFGAILLDFIIFSIIFSFLGGSDSQKASILDDHQKRKTALMSGKNKISLGKEGILLQSGGGGKISLGKDEIVLTGFDGSNEKIDIKSYNKAEEISYKVIFWFLYCWIMVWRFSATLGKMIMKIKVETRDGGKMTADRAFLRALASILSMSVVFAGYLWALGKEKTTWHDIISKTRVVKI